VTLSEALDLGSEFIQPARDPTQRSPELSDLSVYQERLGEEQALLEEVRGDAA
jgi:hypothetical protein